MSLSWPAAWRIARRDLHRRFRGLRLLLVCLFLGVGALAAIGSLTSAIRGELGGGAGPGVGRAGQLERRGDVLLRGHRRQEVERLQHDADTAAPGDSPRGGPRQRC